MRNEEFLEETRKKISAIPNFPKSTIESLLKVWSVVTGRRKERIENKINKIVDGAYNRHVLNSKNPVLSFPSEVESDGDIQLGYVCAGDQVLYPFKLTTENLRENVFVTARAGHGKTTLVFYLVEQLMFHKISFMMFDWKQDYRTLARMFPDILVLRWHDLEFNMLNNAPKGMDIKLWWRIVLDVLAHSTGLLTATPSHILHAIEELYEEKKGVMTFKDLENFLRSQHHESRKEDEYAAVAENRIFSINQALDKVVNVRYGFDVEDLFKQKAVIIEMFPLDFAIASFLIQCLILHEFYRRLYNQVRLNRKSTLDNYFKSNFSMLIMDEAHLTQWGNQETSFATQEGSPAPLSTFFSQSRELLMGTIALTQFSHLIFRAFKENAATKVIGNIVESDLQRDLASSIGFKRESEKILGDLQKGYWATYVAGRTKTFILKTPEVSRGELVAEAELLARSKPLLTKLQMKRQEIESKMFLNQVEKKSSDNVHLPELPQDAWLFLDYVFANPWDYQQKVTEALGFSDRKIGSIKKMLLEKNLIRIEKFAVKVHERVHFILTPNALDIMKTVGKSPQMIAYWRFISKPSYHHRYFQHRLRTQHRILGWKGRLEYDMKNGRRVDVYEEKDGRRKAIEIELSTKDLENKVRVLEEVDELVLLYSDETHLQFAKSKLLKMNDIQGERIWIGLVRDYTDLLDEIIQKTVVKAPETTGNMVSSAQPMHNDDQKRKPDGNIGEKL